MTRVPPAFLRTLTALPLENLVRALRDAVIRSGGTWIEPMVSRRENGVTSPTHMFEIQIFDVSAIGFSQEEAARNWLRAATLATEHSIAAGPQ